MAIQARFRRWIRESRFRRVMDIGVNVVVLAVGLLVLWDLGLISVRGLEHAAGKSGARTAVTTPGVEKPLPQSPVVFGDFPSLGVAGAPVVLVVFSDFQCKFCREFAKTVMPQLRTVIREKRVAVSFVSVPAQGPRSIGAVAAANAVCAGDQGRFWDAHDLLFDVAGGLTEKHVKDIGAKLNLDPARLASCLEKAGSRLRSTVLAGEAVGVTATPTTFVGVNLGGRQMRVTHRLVGAVAVSAFQKAITEAELQASSGR